MLRRAAVRVAGELGWELEPSRSNFLPDSVPRWKPFRETNAQLERFAKKYETGILANIDDKLLGATRRHFRSDFDLVVTAQQVRSYKPDPAHFKECARRIEDKKKRWVHIASGYPTDVEPCLKQKVPVIWVNRSGEDAGERPEEADRGGQDLPGRGEAARRGLIVTCRPRSPSRRRPSEIDRLVGLLEPLRKRRQAGGLLRGQGAREGRAAGGKPHRLRPPRPSVHDGRAVEAARDLAARPG